VVFPCLNEEESIAAVIDEANTALEQAGLVGEIIVADNGSTDRSREIALRKGVRVVDASPRGYGAAYLCGIASARGEIIVMADADMTYPLDRIGDFVAACERSEMAVGIRETKADNMPTLNRLVGNPVLSGLARVLFSATVSDFHCGMRAARKSALNKLKLQTTGMEFASEMIILALQSGLSIEEIPIEYRPRVGESKLNRWTDGWRHVKFLLAHSPNRIFLYPGFGLALIGLIGTLVFVGGPITIAGRPWFVHAQLVFVTLWLVGLQLASLGWLTRSLERISVGKPRGPIGRLVEASMEHALVLGGAMAAGGFAIAAITTLNWGLSGGGELTAGNLLVAGMALLVGGLQLIAVSWCRAMVDVSTKAEPIAFHDVVDDATSPELVQASQ